MAVIITGNNTPTAGGVTYGDGSTYANTAAGTSGQPLVSGGAGAPVFRPYTLPAADGSANQLLQTNGSGALSFATVSAGFTLGTPVATTSGTSINFTGIPAGTKQIVISFIDVSSNGSANFLIQIGDSGGIETASYTSLVMKLIDGSLPEASQATSGFLLTRGVSSGQALRGIVILQLENSSNYTWACSGTLVPAGNILYSLTGWKSLSGVLDRVRLTTDGSDTFDAGEINIAYI